MVRVWYYARTVYCLVENTVHHEAKCDARKHKSQDGKHVEHRRNVTPKRERSDDHCQNRHGEGKHEGGERPAQPEQLGTKAHDEHELFDFDL